MLVYKTYFEDSKNIEDTNPKSGSTYKCQNSDMMILWY